MLHHPNIVELHEVINDQGSANLFLVMQYLKGQSLDELTEKPTQREVKKWSRQLISALYMCHVQAKVAHRDIKPENLKVNGEQKDLVMYDFGASLCFKGDDDLVQKTEGTYSYFSPEILVRKEGRPKIMHGMRCDIWAAGVTLYEIAAQCHPFNDVSLYSLKHSVEHEEPDYSVFGEGAEAFIAFLKRMLTKE